jgi:hypothetical protein
VPSSECRVPSSEFRVLSSELPDASTPSPGFPTRPREKAEKARNPTDGLRASGVGCRASGRYFRQWLRVAEKDNTAEHIPPPPGFPTHPREMAGKRRNPRGSPKGRQREKRGSVWGGEVIKERNSRVERHNSLHASMQTQDMHFLRSCMRRRARRRVISQERWEHRVGRGTTIVGDVYGERARITVHRQRTRFRNRPRLNPTSANSGQMWGTTDMGTVRKMRCGPPAPRCLNIIDRFGVR